MPKRREDKREPQIPASPLRRVVRVEQIRDGEELVWEPTAAERAEIARLQELQALADFRFSYTLRRAPADSVRLSGRLQARPTQTCVVSLEPVQSLIDIPVETSFWPVAAVERWRRESDPENLAAASTDWPEPIVEGVLDLGPLVYESFAMALDPYPRAEGAQLEWGGEEAQDAGKASGQNPFAALQRLKRR